MPSSFDSYDDLPYESLPLPDMHPDYLRAIARLYGVDAAPASACRVLELGCAGGGNLWPFAWYFPRSQCTGIELALGHVQEAKDFIAELGLGNAQILHRSITDSMDDLGEFDYILAHGVFSWVPRAVQDRLLAICGQHLAPNGIAYVSYNTLPGWHVRGLLRDALLGYCAPNGRASQRLAQAHALFDLIEPALRAQTSLEAQLVLKEIDYLRRAAPSYVYHEYLEEINEPLLFNTFMQRAEDAGLAYMADAELWTMFPDTLGAQAADAFAAIPDRLRQEQMLDLARLRKFRRSLLVRKALSVRTTPDLTALESLAYYADLSSEEEIDLGSTSAQNFSSPAGAIYRVNQPLTKAALMLLTLQYPQAIAWEDLHRRAGELIVEHGGSLNADSLEAYRIEFFSLVAYQALRPTFEIGQGFNTLTEHPCAHVMARAQATRGRIVTSVRHTAVELDALSATLLTHLDGTRSVPELAVLMAAALPIQAHTPADPSALTNACTRLLWIFARQGLLHPA